MGCEIEKMCMDLNELLQDICKFLSADKLGKLSLQDQRKAESLINRSKKQLQEIAKIQPSISNEEYVIMSPVVTKEEEECDIYSSVDDVSVKPDEPIIIEDAANPYGDLPAKDAIVEVKSGWISMRRRFLLGFEKMKRVYATIHKDWLLVYLTEKDTKPLCTINLKYFEAKDSDGEKSNFELISTRENENKAYYFVALTHKDMLQWTVQANRCHDRSILGKKNVDTLNSHYERQYSNTNESANGNDDDSDETYEVVVTMKKPNDFMRTGEPMMKGERFMSNAFANPKSPIRRGSNPRKIPINVPPPIIKPKSVSRNNSSSESLASYNEIYTEHADNKSNSNSTKSLEDSFSDESGDSVYEVLTSVRGAVSAMNTVDRNYNNKKNMPLPALPVKKKSS